MRQWCVRYHVSCIYKSVCLFTSRVALSTWPEAWESHERMGSPGQAFLISCGESPKPGKQTFAHFFTISTWGRRQLTWGRRQLPSPCWDCINFFLPAYCEKQPGIRYWYSSIQSKLKCRGVGTTPDDFLFPWKCLEVLEVNMYREYLPDSRGTGRTGTDGPSQTKPQDVYFLKLSNQLCPRRAITRSKC